MIPFRKILVTSLVLCSVGLIGLFFIFVNTLPTLGPRWLFFFLFFVELAGLSLPVTAYLNLRFPSEPLAGSGVPLRQAIWVGIYGDLLAWLQMGRELTFPMALFIAVGFILIEILLRMSERSRWNPKKSENE
ncbi:MAG: hypothetical protein MUO76_23270 [Anaerolineaceae bacterium]|nr:hypothetical protein [Anaerolineaceae bacterium]